MGYVPPSLPGQRQHQFTLFDGLLLFSFMEGIILLSVVITSVICRAKGIYP